MHQAVVSPRMSNAIANAACFAFVGVAVVGIPLGERAGGGDHLLDVADECAGDALDAE